MKKIFLLIILLLLPFIVSAEELKLDWQTSLGGNANDYINGIIQTEDDGFVVAGQSESADIEGITNKGETDAIIAKYDKDGNILWKNSYGGNAADSFNNIKLAKNGDIIAYGHTLSSDIEGMSTKRNYDSFILKYDKNGNMLWQKSFSGNDNDYFSNMLITENEDIIIVGYTKSTDINGLESHGSSDAVIIKYDKDGNILWQRNYGGSESDNFNNFVVTESEDIIAYGYTTSTDIEGLENYCSRNTIIVKYDKDGNILWQRSFCNDATSLYRNFTVTEMENIIIQENLEVTGIDGLTSKGKKDAVLVKYDKDGNVLWKKNFGGNEDDFFTDFKVTESEDIIAYGYTSSTDIEGLPNKGGIDVFIVKYDKDGNIIWKKSFAGNQREYFNGLVVAKTGDIIVIGNTTSTDIEGLENHGSQDAVILKYDKDGNLLWQRSFGGSEREIFSNFIITEIGSLIVHGHTMSTDIEGLTTKGDRDEVIIKYDKDGNLLCQKSFGGSDFEQLNNFIVNEMNEIIMSGYIQSTDIEGLTNKGSNDAVIVKYLIEYELENIESENGTTMINQEGKYGIITPTPDEEYEVDKIIVKDKNGDVLDVEITKLEDGTYSFPLYTDVSVEVLFKEELSNPKTGVFDYISFILIGLLISFIGYNVINYNNQKFEL